MSDYTKAEILNPMKEKKKDKEETRKREQELYELNKDNLYVKEIKRLKRKQKYSRVKEFEYGGKRREKEDAE